jgi:CMP-N-acetylneuraminic acid synthetase
MFKTKSILGIIPARSGSKGIKKKNLKKIGNLSLFEIAIKNSKNSKYLDKIIVTTDDPKILNCFFCGCRVKNFNIDKYI